MSGAVYIRNIKSSLTQLKPETVLNCAVGGLYRTKGPKEPDEL